MRDALALHSLTQNGGLAHALEVLGADNVERARLGFAYLGQSDVAQILAAAAATIGRALLTSSDDERQVLALEISDQQEAQLDDLGDQYAAAQPDEWDEVFRAYADAHPNEFAPPH